MDYFCGLNREELLLFKAMEVETLQKSTVLKEIT